MAKKRLRDYPFDNLLLKHAFTLTTLAQRVTVITGEKVSAQSISGYRKRGLKNHRRLMILASAMNEPIEVIYTALNVK